MLSFTHAAVLGFLQGAAELFPVSSLGHTVLLPSWLNWRIDQASPEFVAFVVLTHFATAFVLFLFFWDDWKKIILGIFRSLAQRRISEVDTYAKLGWLIIVGTVPVGILGLVFEKTFTTLFADPSLVSGALVLNGIVLFIAEKIRTNAHEGVGNDSEIAKLSWKQSIYIGLMECVALVPGFSRTGLAMTGGLINGLSHENSARYAFLLATPVIFAAALLKIPDILALQTFAAQSLFGAVCAGVAAYFSVRFLTKYFEKQTLNVFGLYCVVAGLFFFFSVN